MGTIYRILYKRFEKLVMMAVANVVCWIEAVPHQAFEGIFNNAMESTRDISRRFGISYRPAVFKNLRPPIYMRFCEPSYIILTPDFYFKFDLEPPQG